MSNQTHYKSVLINPVMARDVSEPHRAATPLELFYDLIYVVAIASLAAQMHHAIAEMHHVAYSLWLYLWIFWCIWWPWNTYTWFASGYDTDDAQFRLASMAQMVGVIAIAVSVKPAYRDGNFMIMMMGYVIMRIPYALMWFKVAHDDPHSRPVALRYAVGVLIAQSGWALAVLFYQSWLVFIGLFFIEMAIPYFAEISVDKGKNTRYHHGHIEERLGLLTIIVLGESILALIHAVGTTLDHFGGPFLRLVAGSLLLIFSMWWLYFDDKVGDGLCDETKTFIWIGTSERPTLLTLISTCSYL